jgi:hypothetical protein
VNVLSSLLHSIQSVKFIFSKTANETLNEPQKRVPTLATPLFLWLGWDTLYLQFFMAFYSSSCFHFHP